MSETEEFTFIVDTREQNPFWKNDVVTKKLDFGDYSIEGYETDFAIERKSMADLVGTLTSGHARFKRELQRAQIASFFAIVVEGSYEDLLAQRWSGSAYTKVKGFQIASIVDTLRVKYGIHIYFCKDRRGAKTLTRNLAKSFWKIKQAELKAESRQIKTEASQIEQIIEKEYEATLNQ